MLQDVFLFSGTVRENIAFGDRDRGGDAVERALAEVGGARLAARLPRGLEEDVGERGGYLSLGERQILAFARALHYDPAILILDEATSSVDVETEREIQAALHRLLEGRTSLVIAHRLSTILDADRILVMHKGRAARAGHPRGAAREARDLRPALRAPVQPQQVLEPAERNAAARE